MTTIKQVVDEHTDGDTSDLIAALEEREQEAIEKLRLYAERFGLLPPVVNRVLLELGLGDPDEETQKFIADQYQGFIVDYKKKVEEQIAAYRARGIPVPDAEFVDPFTIPLDTSVPDTPPEE